MAEQGVAHPLLFPTRFDRPLVATFDTLHQSFDGGAILLKAIDDEIGLTAPLAACLPERRQEGKIGHDLPTLITGSVLAAHSRSRTHRIRGWRRRGAARGRDPAALRHSEQ